MRGEERGIGRVGEEGAQCIGEVKVRMAFGERRASDAGGLRRDGADRLRTEYGDPPLMSGDHWGGSPISTLPDFPSSINSAEEPLKRGNSRCGSRPDLRRCAEGTSCLNDPPHCLETFTDMTVCRPIDVIDGNR